MEVQEMAISGVLRILLIIIVVYYVLKLLRPFIRRILYPTPPQGPGQSGYSRTRRDGMTVEYDEKDKKKPSSDDLGDFVDYEEIK